MEFHTVGFLLQSGVRRDDFSKTGEEKTPSVSNVMPYPQVRNSTVKTFILVSCCLLIIYKIINHIIRKKTLINPAI